MVVKEHIQVEVTKEGKKERHNSCRQIDPWLWHHCRSAIDGLNYWTMCYSFSQTYKPNASVSTCTRVQHHSTLCHILFVPILSVSLRSRLFSTHIAYILHLPKEHKCTHLAKKTNWYLVPALWVLLAFLCSSVSSHASISSLFRFELDFIFF